jgi:plastocyanin
MKQFILFALLAAGLVALVAPQVAPQDAQAWGRGHSRVAYTPVYYCPPPVYSMPAYNPPTSYMRPAQQVVEVGAYDKVGFKPKSITVAPGTTVRWVNYGEERHTVTSRDGLFDSGPLSPGATYSVTFMRPGTYHYFCRPHEKMGMVGTVVVGSGGSGPGYGGSGY